MGVLTIFFTHWYLCRNRYNVCHVWNMLWKVPRKQKGFSLVLTVLVLSIVLTNIVLSQVLTIHVLSLVKTILVLSLVKTILVLSLVLTIFCLFSVYLKKVDKFWWRTIWSTKKKRNKKKLPKKRSNKRSTDLVSWNSETRY